MISRYSCHRKVRVCYVFMWSCAGHVNCFYLHRCGEETLGMQITGDGMPLILFRDIIINCLSTEICILYPVRLMLPVMLITPWKQKVATCDLTCKPMNCPLLWESECVSHRRRTLSRVNASDYIHVKSEIQIIVTNNTVFQPRS